MYQLELSNTFKKEFQRMLKRGHDGELLLSVVDLLLAEKKLPEKCRPHKLSGSYGGFWDCHVKPDWVLIYELDEKNKKLTLVRTGTHSDLFR